MMKTLSQSREPRLVAIVGGSGAGKSWLVRQLRRRVGKDAAQLCQDDFYRDRAHMTLERRAKANFDHPRSIDWPALEQVLLKCRAHQPMPVPRYDFKRHVRVGRMERWTPKPLVLVEGLWLLRRPALRKLFALRIFVECPERVRWRRRLRRDLAERGRRVSDVRRQFQNQVIPMHERYVAPQVRWADIVVRSPLRSREIDELVGRIRERCAEG